MNDHQRMLARHAALVSDKRLPLQFTPLSAISVLEGRVVGHGHEENAGRPYLLLEGVEGKIHLLWQSPEIEAKRRQGLLRVNSFARIEKHVAGGCLFLTVQDLGNSWKLLQNDAYFRQAATRMLRTGPHVADPNWGGWLGGYQKKLSTQIIALRDQGRQHERERSLGR